ncbi:hypothetical protein Tco_1580334 [Tanacetum coccineum]
MIAAGVDNYPPMLEKTMYNSWQSCILLYIKGQKNDRMLLKYVLEGPLVYPTIEENGVTRLTTYEELSKFEIEQSYLCKALNSHTKNVSVSYTKFASIKVETLHEYYMRFAQIMNDIHINGMTMQQVQVNTKFLNGLQPEWSKFVTDVKLAKSMYTTNYD